MEDRSTGNDLLWRATNAGRAHRRYHAAPANRGATGRLCQRQRLRLEGPDTPSTHLISAADRQMNVPHLMKSRGLGLPHRGPIPLVSNRKLILEFWKIADT
jgi:hypothetical protein